MAKSQKKRLVPVGALTVATNRVAHRDYEIIETLEVGIQLRGSEVKSLRESKVQLSESYVIVFQKELWLVGLHVSAYSHSAGAFGHESNRRRKLLAHRVEIDRWEARVDREKLALIPLAMYFKKGRAKLEIALGRGKSQTDRRHDIARRDAERDAQRELSRARRKRHKP